MAITQKKVKEAIANSEKMIADTVEEKEELLEVIRQLKNKSEHIDLLNDEELVEKVDELNGLTSTIEYFTGHLNALHWVLDEMRAKNKKKKGDK